MSGKARGRAATVLIAGPTAGGKSALALALARDTGGVVINADAMQVYRELRVLTARPGADEEDAAPHRLYGFVAAGDPYSVGRWLDAAGAEIAAAHAQGRTAIVVGGTGLYFESLVNGLARIPPVPRAVRDKWREVLADQGAQALRAALEAADPAMAAQIAPADRQRTLRALEVLEATGRSLASWQSENDPGVPGVSGAVRIVVAPQRAALHGRIDARAAAMIDAGALEEVENLLRLGLDPDLPAMKAIGVRELGPVIAGRADLDDALTAMRTATRRYAKRQMTWVRGRMAGWRHVEDAAAGLAAFRELAG